MAETRQEFSQIGDFCKPAMWSNKGWILRQNHYGQAQLGAGRSSFCASLKQQSKRSVAADENLKDSEVSMGCPLRRENQEAM